MHKIILMEIDLKNGKHVELQQRKTPESEKIFYRVKIENSHKGNGESIPFNNYIEAYAKYIVEIHKS